MKIVVRANDVQRGEWLAKKFSDNVSIIWLMPNEPMGNISADAFFDLTEEDIQLNHTTYNEGLLLFINRVTITAKEIQHPNVVRINAWNGFLNNSAIEVAAGDVAVQQKANIILSALGCNYIWVPDVPGMISARVICMIINEAYYGLQDGISTKTSIDIAMKLGTNYPFGPFEWSEKIGLKNVYNLLEKLSENDLRYLPASQIKVELGLLNDK